MGTNKIYPGKYLPVERRRAQNLDLSNRRRQDMTACVARIILITMLASTGAINICVAKTGSSTPSGQEPDFRVKFSEPLAVYVFVQSLSSKSRFAPNYPFKKMFTDSRFNQEKYKALVAEFETLTLDYHYEYGPEKLGGSTWLLL